MRQAKIDYAEAFRGQRLEAQETSWRHAAGLAQYINALRVHAAAPATETSRQRPFLGAQRRSRTDAAAMGVGHPWQRTVKTSSCHVSGCRRDN